jgi:putative aldouronate transport system substrate-binding protein
LRAAIVQKDVVRINDKLPNAILPSWMKNSDAISKLIKEYEINFITGAADTDKGFDDFVAQLNKLGLQEATEEANKLYADRTSK